MASRSNEQRFDMFSIFSTDSTDSSIRKHMQSLIDTAQQVQPAMLEDGAGDVDTDLKQFSDLVSQQTYFSAEQSALAQKFTVSYENQKQLCVRCKKIAKSIYRALMANTSIPNDTISGAQGFGLYGCPVVQFKEYMQMITAFDKNSCVQDDLHDIEKMIREQTCFTEDMNKLGRSFIQSHTKYKQELQECFRAMTALADNVNPAIVITLYPKEGKPIKMTMGTGKPSSTVLDGRTISFVCTDASKIRQEHSAKSSDSTIMSAQCRESSVVPSAPCRESSVVPSAPNDDPLDPVE